MAYWDWNPEFQDMWDSMPIDMDSLPDAQYEYAEFMFEEGFMRYHGESPPEDISFARQEFYDIVGWGEYGDDYFDWDAWREAMYP